MNEVRRLRKAVDESKIDLDRDRTESRRKAHVALCAKLVEVVEKLPNPIKELDEEMRLLNERTGKLEEERDALAAKCKHLAWRDHGGYDYFLIECVQCGKQELV